MPVSGCQGNWEIVGHGCISASARSLTSLGGEAVLMKTDF